MSVPPSSVARDQVVGVDSSARRFRRGVSVSITVTVTVTVTATAAIAGMVATVG